MTENNPSWRMNTDGQLSVQNPDGSWSTVLSGQLSVQNPDGSWSTVLPVKGRNVFRKHLTEAEIIATIWSALNEQAIRMPGTLQLELHPVHNGRFFRANGLIDLHALAKAIKEAGEMSYE